MASALKQKQPCNLFQDNQLLKKPIQLDLEILCQGFIQSCVVFELISLSWTSFGLVGFQL